jgi:hypothetical protein
METPTSKVVIVFGTFKESPLPNKDTVYAGFLKSIFIQAIVAHCYAAHCYKVNQSSREVTELIKVCDNFPDFFWDRSLALPKVAWITERTFTEACAIQSPFLVSKELFTIQIETIQGEPVTLPNIIENIIEASVLRSGLNSASLARLKLFRFALPPLVKSPVKDC